MKLSDFVSSSGYVLSNDIGTVIDIVNDNYYFCGLLEGEYTYIPLIPFTPSQSELDSDGWFLLSRFLS